MAPDDAAIPVLPGPRTFTDEVFEAVLGCPEKDPLRMYERVREALERRWTDSERLPVHGAWHHILVPGILLAALRNNGNDVDDQRIVEGMRRGSALPEGACGFHGLCGAGAGIGVALSVVSGTTPMSDEPRSRGLEATSEVLRRIGKLGGPRCCVLSTYTALSLGARVLRDLGYDIPVTKASRRCLYGGLNEECHAGACPYHPGERPRSGRGEDKGTER